MITRLRRHLTLLFTCATGTVLTLILAAIFVFQLRAEDVKANESFQNYLLDFTNKLESATSLKDDWLARMEAANGLIIHIEENGIPLFFSGVWNPRTDRDTLIELAKKEAGRQGVDTSLKTVTTSMAQTGTFSLNGSSNDNYRAYALVLSYQDTYRSLILLQDTTEVLRRKILQGLFYLLLDFIGIFALYLVSRYVIIRALKPVAEAQQRQTEFVAAASHELRSPLAVIQASASAITVMPEQAPKMADAIQQECIRAGNLVKNLLLLASADSGQLMEPSKLMDADLLLLRLYENYEPLCQSKGICLKLQMPEELLPQIHSNDVYLYQIMAILLDNAIAYGKPKTGSFEVLLKAASTEDALLLSVSDRGPGIPEEEKERIFHRFYRSDQARSKKEHFGLGLSIAAKLAANLRLTLSVADTEGGGTTFSVRFPTKTRVSKEPFLNT